MVGSDYFPFGARPIFRGYSLVVGRVYQKIGWWSNCPTRFSGFAPDSSLPPRTLLNLGVSFSPRVTSMCLGLVFQHLGVEGFRSHFGENGCLRMSAMLLARELKKNNPAFNLQMDNKEMLYQLFAVYFSYAKKTTPWVRKKKPPWVLIKKMNHLVPWSRRSSWGYLFVQFPRLPRRMCFFAVNVLWIYLWYLSVQMHVEPLLKSKFSRFQEWKSSCWWFRNPKQQPPFGCVKIL